MALMPLWQLLHGAYESEVTEAHRRPRDRAMTGAAVLARLDVLRGLAGGEHPVVTARATGSNTEVIEPRRQPRERGVAILAGAVACDVGWPFARREHAVVTARAIAGDSGVRETRRAEPAIAPRMTDAGTADGAAPAAFAGAMGALTTMPTLLLPAVATFDTAFFAAPPPQLLGLWQPLQSLPT